MVTTGPIPFLKGIIFLVASEFERKYSDFNKGARYFNDGKWNLEIIERGLFIDLSQVRWIDIGAAAQLVLLIESVKRVGAKVTIRLPFPEITQGELNHAKKQPQKQKMFESFSYWRRNALKYLRNIQFESAVKCEHIRTGEVLIETLEDINSIEEIVDIDYEEPSNQDLRNSDEIVTIEYKFILPLTWVTIQDKDENIEFLEHRLQHILGESDRGLDKIDALAIKNVIISELVKNVHQHAQSDYALIGAVLQPSIVEGEVILNPEYFPICERNYFAWSTSTYSNYISIYFGDTGDGLVKTLTEEFGKIKGKISAKTKSDEIIEWSFDRWSTSKRDQEIRGTKGLYRIQRIINKYDGLITIRTSDRLAGFQKGGMKNATFIKEGKGLSPFPGTFIRMQMSPFVELAKFNINPNPSREQYEDEYEWFPVAVTIGSAWSEAIRKLERTLSYVSQIRKGTKVINFLVKMHLNEDGISEEDKEVAIRDLLTSLSKIRHPNAVAVFGSFGSLGWDKIEQIIISANAILNKKAASVEGVAEALHYDLEEVYDPVLVFGDKRNYTWFGNDEKVIHFLNEIYDENFEGTDIDKINSFQSLSKKEQTKISQSCRIDHAFTNSPKQILSLLWDFSNLRVYFQLKLKARLLEIKEKPSGNEYYVTPNLLNVSHWIDITEILDGEEMCYAFALSSFLKECLNEDENQAIYKTKILVDNYESFGLAKALADWEGIPHSNIINLSDEVDGRLPRRNPIFERRDQVIILSTIISSSETIRRSIKTVLRDGAIPVCVLSLIDYRNHTNEIKIWGKKSE